MMSVVRPNGSEHDDRGTARPAARSPGSQPRQHPQQRICLHPLARAGANTRGSGSIAEERAPRAAQAPSHNAPLPGRRSNDNAASTSGNGMVRLIDQWHRAVAASTILSGRTGQRRWCTRAVSSAARTWKEHPCAGHGAILARRPAQRKPVLLRGRSPPHSAALHAGCELRSRTERRLLDAMALALARERQPPLVERRERRAMPDRHDGRRSAAARAAAGRARPRPARRARRSPRRATDSPARAGSRARCRGAAARRATASGSSAPPRRAARASAGRPTATSSSRMRAVVERSGDRRIADRGRRACRSADRAAAARSSPWRSPAPRPCPCRTARCRRSRGTASTCPSRTGR